MVLLARCLRHVLPLHLASRNLLGNVSDELVNGTVHLGEKNNQGRWVIDLCGLLKGSQGSPHACGPSLHVLHLQRCLLKPHAAAFMILKHLVQLFLFLIPLKVEKSGPRGSIGVEGDAVSVSLESVELLSKSVQSHLRLFHRLLQLFVLDVSVEELRDDVHNISEACNFTNLLERIL